MTDRLREAAQAALEALVIAEAGLADIGDADREPGDDLAWCERRAAEALEAPRKAIAPLRAALAEPEEGQLPPLPECYVTSGGRDLWREEDLIAYGRACAALAEPQGEQEPADDVWFEDRNGAVRKSPKDCQRFGANGVPEAVWVNGDCYVRREWRSLTEEERQRALDSTHPDNRWTLTERVEYRLKEKNA